MKYQFDPFVYEYDRVYHPLYDFKTECVLAAKKCLGQNTKNSPIIIMMSGGIDSEIIAESFRLAGIPFKVLIGRLIVSSFTDTIILNEHDYSYAERWCNRNNVEIVYCDIDVFQNAKLLTEYSISSRGFSPQYAWHMYMMKFCNDNGYFFVAGLGDIDIVLHNEEYCSKDTQREWSIDIFCENNNLDGVIRFCKIDSQMTAAYLKLNRVKSLMDDKANVLLEHKHYIYAEVFDFEPRVKYTGFELIQEWDSILRTNMKKYNSHFDTISYLPVSFFGL
jgi:hypothetical protein